MKTFDVGQLHVKLLKDRDELGRVSAADAGNAIVRILEEKGKINIIFASAPSQNEFLKYLSQDSRIDWSKVHAMNMDEYVGIDPEHPAGFGNYIIRNIYSKVHPGTVELYNPLAEDPQAECDRYAEELAKFPPDIIFYGIGETCHLAFNDPPVADFQDPVDVKLVPLDEVTIQQQINDKCFEKLEDVPRTAYTITCPVIMRAPLLFGMVPGKTKIDAIYNVLNAEISTQYPATILREHPNAWLYIDEDSASRLPL